MFHKFLISNKLFKSGGAQVARPIVRLSVIGTALGIFVMVVAMAITTGYKNEIRQKVINMGAHIRISNLATNHSFDLVPFDRHQPFLETLRANPDIANVSAYATKVGVVKTDNQVEGIVLKGVEADFFHQNFVQNIVDGAPLQLGDSVNSEILISSSLAKKLQLRVGDKLRTYFVQEPPRQRSFVISGIYETGMPEYDDAFAIVDLRQIQKLNQWDSNLVGGIELLINDYDKLDAVADFTNAHISHTLKAETIKTIYPQIFDWIALFDTNVIVLLIITIFVCIITMISTFFIIVLEKIQTIGLLKAFGMQTGQVLRLFTHLSMRIILGGLLLGNALALTCCFAQSQWHLIKLDAATYYIGYVPIELTFGTCLMLNGGIFALSLLVMTLPAYVVAKRITPIAAIRLD